MVANFKDAFSLESRMAQLTFKWLIALAPLIALSIFSKRYFIIVLGALLPNLLISIGGAEKTGFWTHYHAVYFPILIGFSTIAIAKIGTIQTKLVPIAISLLMIIYNLFINIDDDSKVFKTNSIEEARGVLNRYIELHPNSDLNKSLTINGNYFFDLAKSIPKDITVSSPEILMPALVKNGNRLVDYFPIGLGINEYLIAQVDSKSGMYIVPTFLDNNSGQSIQKCVTEIINQKYVKMEHINKDFNQSIEILKLRNKNN